MSLQNGFKRVITITASDTVADPGGPIDALFVTTAGNLTILPVDGAAIAMVAVPAGTFIPIKTRRVNSSGLTAVVVGLWGN
jgi:hypothetical protein